MLEPGSHRLSGGRSRSCRPMSARQHSIPGTERRRRDSRPQHTAPGDGRAHRDPSVPRRDQRRGDRWPPWAVGADAMAGEGASRGLVDGDPVGVRAGARRVLGGVLQHATRRRSAERIRAVHDDDRRGRHPLPARALARGGGDAVHHDARLAGVGDGVRQGDRSARGSGQPRRGGVRRARARDPVATGVRVERQTDRDRLERREGRGGRGSS